jgi:hypothetical protein
VEGTAEMIARWLQWLGLWCLRRSGTMAIQCGYLDDDAQKAPHVVVFIIQNSALVPGFIIGAAHTYCMHTGQPIPTLEDTANEIVH